MLPIPDETISYEIQLLEQIAISNQLIFCAIIAGIIAFALDKLLPY